MVCKALHRGGARTTFGGTIGAGIEAQSSIKIPNLISSNQWEKEWKDPVKGSMSVMGT
jgi:hypothetical protein